MRLLGDKHRKVFRTATIFKRAAPWVKNTLINPSADLYALYEFIWSNTKTITKSLWKFVKAFLCYSPKCWRRKNNGILSLKSCVYKWKHIDFIQECHFDIHFCFHLTNSFTFEYIFTWKASCRAAFTVSNPLLCLNADFTVWSNT